MWVGSGEFQMRMGLIAFAALCASASAGVAASAAPQPASAFGRLPGIQTAVISPDGSKIAILGGSPDQRTVTFAPIDASKGITVGVGKTEVKDIQWAGDNYVLLRTSTFTQGHWPWNHQAYAYHLERDISISAEGKVLARMLNDSNASAFATGLPILATIDGPKPAVILSGLDWSTEGLAPDVNTKIKTNQSSFSSAIWKVDVQSGHGKIIERGNEATTGWAVDLAGEGRVRVDYNPVTHVYTVLGRPKGAMGWKILDQSALKDDPINVFGYSDAEDAAYLGGSDAHDVYHIRRLSLADGTSTEIGPYAPAKQGWVKWDDDRKAPLAVVTEADRRTYHWLDPEIGAVHAKLSRAFKGKHVYLANWSKDRTRFVIEVSAPDAPPTWLLFDNKTNQASPIGDYYPELAAAQFGKVSWFTYKARDGLEIPAYLTLPPGAASAAKLPLIVMPHGGPAARDDEGFYWWSQFLASRGYAVLRPQFRGSSGFGRAFEKAGEHEWAGKMQTDLLDGIADLAAKGTIDPARVCIVGASYGGYAAVAGATFHPEAYRCAVSVNGVSDLSMILGEYQRLYGVDSPSVQYWIKVLGESNSDQVVAASPAKHVAGVAGPILLIHGKEDTVVPYEQSQKMNAALQDAGKPVTFITLDGDDHYLSSTETRTKMLEATEAFLAKALPVAQ